MGEISNPSHPAVPIAQTIVNSVVRTIAITPTIDRSNNAMIKITSRNISGVCVLRSRIEVSEKVAEMIIEPVAKTSSPGCAAMMAAF